MTVPPRVGGASGLKRWGLCLVASVNHSAFGAWAVNALNDVVTELSGRSRQGFRTVGV